jgi:anaerobic selenocysteine-containing dehydrogenase
MLSGAGGAALAFEAAITHLPPSEMPQEILPGIESQKTTTCLMCPGGCGIRVRCVDGYPKGISGNPNHPLNAGGVCSEGISALQLLYHPDRLKRPMMRKGGARTGSFEPVTWEEASGAVAEAMRALLQRGAADRLAFVLGRQGGSMEALVKHFMAVWGSPRLLMDDWSSEYGRVFDALHGFRFRPAFDFDRSDLVLSFGADLLNAWDSPLHFQRSHASFREPERGFRRKLIVADVRFSHTASLADEWIGIAPGTHGALALGIAYVMIRERLYDTGFVEEHVYGFEDIDMGGRTQPGFRNLVLRDYSPEIVSHLCGIPAEKILELGKSFGEQPAAVALFDENAVAQPGGFHAGMAIHSLNLLKGNLDRPGGIYLQPEVPLTPLGSHPQEAAGAAEDLPGLASSDAPPEVLFLYYSNPLYSSPFRREIGDALKKIRTVISFSPFMDETCRFADIILPDCLPLERWEDRLFPSPYPAPGWGIVQPCVAPLADVRHSGDVLLELAQRLGEPTATELPWKNFEELLRHRAQGIYSSRSGSLCIDPFHQGLVGEIERRGWWVSGEETFPEFWQKLLEAGAWVDPNYQVRGLSDYSRNPDGRIDLFSRALGSRLTVSERGPSNLECLPHFHSAEEPRIDPGHPMTLIPYRPGKRGGGSHGGLPWILQSAGEDLDLAWNSWVEIHPEDARSHQIRHLDWIRVESPSGSVRVRAVLNAGAALGVINMPCGLGHHAMGRYAQDRGVNPMDLLVPERDPLTGMPYRFGTKVKVYRA